MRSAHTFHIPVLGTGFSIDTPLKVARYGISSVISLVDDVLIEQMRKFHSFRAGLDYHKIGDGEEDCRARRITAYLDLLNDLVEQQVKNLQASPFDGKSDICRYYEMLPDSPQKSLYGRMTACPDDEERARMQKKLRDLAVPGQICVNIMTKVDREAVNGGQKLPQEYSDAMSAFRGYARSSLRSSIILSAGLNPHLYSYIGEFDDFYPDGEGSFKKKVILKVSDYRSAIVQGKFLAKRGVWVSEYRIESGINCGGHAFPTSGKLLGPIMDEFRWGRDKLAEVSHAIYAKALAQRGRPAPETPPDIIVTVQGGIGTAGEDRFMLNYYKVDGTGWGTPFLLVPEAVNVDETTLEKLKTVESGDVYLSGSSPFGVPFWNMRTSASEEARRRRIEEGNPGSVCRKGFLKLNREFDGAALCAASRAYIKKKLGHLSLGKFTDRQITAVKESILAKSCICNDLAGSATVKHGIRPKDTPAVCCGPNIVNFRRTATLEEMVSHIYGRLSLLADTDRPHVFVREIMLYLSYVREEIEKYSLKLSSRTPGYFNEFRENLLSGIEHYRSLAEQFIEEQKSRFLNDLGTLQQEIELIFSAPVLCEDGG